MPRVCTICTHPEREAIDTALVDGPAFPALAALYRVSEDSLGRHKAAHLPGTLAKAHEAQEAAHADSLLAQMEKLTSDARRIGEKAEKMGDLRTALAGVRELVRIVELTAKLRGELAQEGTVNVLVAPEWLQVRAVLLQTLAPYPEARAAVAANLVALEAGR